MKLTGVGAEFRASHDDPRGEERRHSHTYAVTAWFPAGSDARDLQRELELVLTRLDGTHLEPDFAWGEELAEAIGQFMPDCIEVELRRERERIFAKWVQVMPRSLEKRALIMRLYQDGASYRKIADEAGGTEDGVRSTIRKMVERGALVAR